jgi:hypothetical protein
MKDFRLAMVVIFVLIVSGCSSIGPKSIAVDRGAYNMAVQQTNDQELLLNMVRIRYRDTLYFTSVERIAATQELIQTLGGSAGGAITDNAYVGGGAATSLGSVFSRTLTLAPSFSVNEKPTVFYAPVEGEKFVRQMMTPMNPDLLLLMVKSGWSMDRVFSVGVQEMNGLKNAPTASGPTPSREPEFRDFREAVKLLRALQRENLIDLGKVSGKEGIELRFSIKSQQRKESVRLKELLGLASGPDRFRIVIGSEVPDAETIVISTRPMISALNYLSQGIDAPPADVAAGKVRKTVRANGETFDWQEMLEGVFHVSVSDNRPEDASVVIVYRGRYFYIADNDLESKSTFVLVSQLIALNSAPAGNAPAMSFSFGK